MKIPLFTELPKIPMPSEEERRAFGDSWYDEAVKTTNDLNRELDSAIRAIRVCVVLIYGLAAVLVGVALEQTWRWIT